MAWTRWVAGWTLGAGALLLVGCSLLLRPEGTPDADADLDGDSDADLDGDGDHQTDGDVADGDADSDVETDDADADSDPDGDPPIVTGVTARRLSPPAPYRAGTSAILELEVTWDRAPVAGVEVQIAASGGGLVSLATEPGATNTARLASNDDGGLENVRVTFPLEPWSYEVALTWTQSATGASGGVDGDHEFSVEEPDSNLTHVSLGATQLDLVPGLDAEDYPVDDEFTSVEFDGVSNALSAMTFTSGSYGEYLVVSSHFETCFVTPDGEASCGRTRPSSPDGVGPDQIVDLAFDPGDPDGDPPPRLFAGGGGTDGGGGLYELGAPPAEGTSERIYGFTNGGALDLVLAHDTLTPGLYFVEEGAIAIWDRAEDKEPFCAEYMPHAASIGIGDGERYGELPLFTAFRSTTEGRYVVGRVGESCMSLTLDDESDFPGRLRRSPGMVFGRMLYLVRNEQVLLLRDSVEGLALFRAVAFTDGSRIVDIAFQPYRPGAGHHPPGLYLLLENELVSARVIRLCQDLDD